MKSILLTSSSSNSQTSNNLSLLAESYGVEENSEIFKVDSVKEILDDDEGLTETVLVDSVLLKQCNIKKQVIKSNKFSSKNDAKLKRSDRNIYSDIKCEKRKEKTASDVSSEFFALNLESHPLIETNNVIVNENDNLSSRGEKVIPSVITQVNSTSSTKLINLRKKNGTTLIFQSKNCSQPSQQQLPTPENCGEYQELEIESYKKRQSLHWPPYKSAISNPAKSYKSRHYSWHDPRIYSQNSIEEEFENSVSIHFLKLLQSIHNIYLCSRLSALYFLISVLQMTHFLQAKIFQ